MSEKKTADISLQELIEEYGMTEENAQKLLLDLPNIVQEFIKEAEAKAQAERPPPAAPTFQLAPSRQFTGVEKEDVDTLDEMIFLTEEDMEDLADITDEEIYQALDCLDQIVSPIQQLIERLQRGTPSTGFGGPILGPIAGGIEAIAGRPRTLVALLLEELFGEPTEPATLPVPETPTPTPARRTPARPRRAPRATRRPFLTRLRTQANALDEKFANDELAFYDIYPYADEIVMTIDSKDFVVEDGVLKTHAIATANMVQSYGDKKVLKDAEELKKACDYARQIPITDDHPPEKIVTSQNQVMGFTGQVSFDEEKKNIQCDIEITDADLIVKVQKGKTDVSIGFMCDMDNTPGEFGGEKYDAIQRNIILNHLAIVDNGRCPGGTCGLGLDHQKACIKTDEECEECKNKKSDEEIHYTELTEGIDEDAKLTAVQRKALPEDVFCGPDRSFPVPDIAHFTAALRLLGRYKGPGDKDEIKDCIMKKGKELGAPGAEDNMDDDKKTGDAKDQPKTEAERAMSHFNISPEEWEKMTDAEKAAKIAELPPLGSGREDEGFEGEYILEDTEGHTHSVTLDKEGNGKSSKNGDHEHDIVENDCQEVAGHKHSIVANASKDDDPDEEPAEDDPAEDLDVSTHEKLLKEKVDAIKTLSDKLARGASSMTPQEIQALISDIERIGWDLRDMTAVIQSKDISVDETILDSAKEFMNIGKKLLTDNKPVADEHASLVDEVMDHNPPNDREFYEKKSLDELKELVLLLDTTDPKDTPSDSDDGQAKSVQDAYDKAISKRLGKA